MGNKAVGSIDELLDEVRRASLGNEYEALYRRLSDRLAARPPAPERGGLHLARALLTQNNSDPRPAAADATAAWELLRRSGDLAHAAFAAAGAATMLQRCGRLAEGVDLAVESMVLLDEVEMEPFEAVRIANALALVFGQLSAFDIAVDLSERAFLGSDSVGAAMAEVVAFTLAYLTIDGCHTREEPPARWLELAATASEWLNANAQTVVGTAMFADGVTLELAMLNDDRRSINRALAEDDGSDDGIYTLAADRVVAWHAFVRGAGLGRIGRYPASLRLLDLAIPNLTLADDQPRLARAMRARAETRRSLGDLDGAFTDAVELADLVRRWQVEQVGRLAAQITRRAELERATDQLSKRAAELAAAASTDVVTGVSTRRQLELSLDELSESNGDGAVIVFDLDRFKSVNDRFSHRVGDVVLRQIGDMLRTTTGSHDVAARYGGEEFVVVLRGADTETAFGYAERIRARLAAESWGPTAEGLTVTCSAGVAVGGFGEIRDLLHRADDALYEAKRAGRDRTVVWTSATPHTVANRPRFHPERFQP